MNKKSNLHLPYSVRTSLFLSYMIVLFMPILFNSFTLYFNFKTVRNQADLALSVSDEQFTNLINTYVDEVHNNGSALILSDAAQNLMNYSDLNANTNRISQMRTLQKDLAAKMIVCDYITGIYLYFPRSGTILTEQSVYYNYNFTYKCRYSLGMTIDEWNDFTCFDGYEQFMLFHSRLDGRDHILIAQKNRSTSDGSMDMLVVTELDIDFIQNILDRLSNDGQQLVLLYDQESGHALSSGKDGESSSISYQVDTGTISAENAMLSSHTTNFNNLQCTILMPLSIYRHSLAPSILGICIYLLVCLFGGFLVIWYLTKKQYSPIEKITSGLLTSMEQNAPSSDINEYEQIEEALTTLLHKRADDQKEDLILRQSFRQNILRTILLGHIHKDSITYRHAVNNGILFDSNRFLVIIYNIEDINNALYQIEPEYDNALYSLLDTIVCTAAQDSTDSRYTRYAVEIEEWITCIVCCPTDLSEEQILSDMQRDSNRICDFLASKFAFTLSAAISSIHEEVENISNCFNEAKETADYMETMGLSSQAFLYGSIPSTISEPIAFASILEKERLFCNCMKVSDFATCKQLLREIIDSFDLSHCSASEARMRVYGLISLLSSSLDDVRDLLHENQIPNINPDTYLHMKDVNALCHQAELLMDQLIDAHMQQKKSATVSREHEMVQYVEEHLTDGNLNISVLADQFEMSPSYFSRLFKKITGAGLLDYIHMKRIELAKEQIRQNPQKPLKDIAEQVGYATPLALNRAFRKYEGISPSSYRDNLI